MAPGRLGRVCRHVRVHHRGPHWQSMPTALMRDPRRVAATGS